MPKPILSPTIFLDTNAIHNAISYLILADQYKLNPFGPVKEISKIKAELGKILPGEFYNHLIDGLYTLDYLQNQVEEKNARVYTSRLTIAEMWSGRLDGQAHIRMSLQGIPYRLRQRQNVINKLVMARLTQADYEKVNNELGGLSQNWYERFGFELTFVEDTTNARDILLLALEIQKLTFIDVIDCILMAGSLAILSSEFITSDAMLFEVMERIKHPKSLADKDQRALWEAAQMSILEQLRILHLDKSIGIGHLVEPRKPSKLKIDVSKLHLI